MMDTAAPYRLQVFLPDDVREALREAAHRHRTSQQKLVLSWLIEKLNAPETDVVPAPDPATRTPSRDVAKVTP